MYYFQLDGHFMKHEILYNSFLEEIVQRIPQKTRIVGILADMLCISKEAIYKRLRGDVPFTFYEVMVISKQLQIPLDTLKVDDSPISKPFKLKLIEYINPAESDFALMEEMITILQSLKDVPNAEGGEITNIVPQPLYVAYESLFKFYLFKWRYQSNSLDKTIPYKDIIISDRLRKTQKENMKWAKYLHTDYIFDNLLFHYLVNNIKYFYYVGLITKEEIESIKQDLLRLLDEIDLLSRTGYFKETGKKINIYISNVNIDTGYCFINSPDHQMTVIKAFLLNGIASTDKKTFEEMMHWVQSVKQQSILITKSSEKRKISFLKEQHEIIESLSNL